MRKTDILLHFSVSAAGDEARHGRLCGKRGKACLLALVLGLSMPPSASLFGQVLEKPSERDTSGDGIYVRDDDESINRLLREAGEASAIGRVDEAVDRYQSVIDRHVDQLVRWSAETFESAREAAKREIADGPAALREAYRSRFESKAKAEMDAAVTLRSESRLREIADRYPFTDAGLAAGTRLADLAFERGEDGAAIALSRRLLGVLPKESLAERASARARVALAFKRLSDGLSLSEWIAATPLDERGVSVRLRGESHPLTEILEALKPSPAGSADWSGFLGGNARAGAPYFHSGPFAGPGPTSPKDPTYPLAWSFDHARPLSEAMSPADEESLLLRLIAEDSELPRVSRALQPVIAAGRLLFYDSRRAFAVDLESGKAIWYRDLSEFGSAPALGMRSTRRTYLAAANRDLFVMVLEIGSARERPRVLVALSTADGSTRWTRGGPNEPDESVRSLLFTGAPVLAEGAVLLGARGSGNEIKAYAVGFDADGGSLRFVRFLGSGPPVPEYDQGSERGETPTASYAAGSLFVGTGIGILSAVDPWTGEHLWCFRYARIPFRSALGKVRTLSYAEPWIDDPLIATAGRIFTTPVDSSDLYVLLQVPDRASGHVALCRRPKDNYRYLVGVRNGVVFLAGNDITDRFPEVASFHPEGGAEEEAWPPFMIPNLPGERTVRRDELCGRGVVAGEALLIPTRKTVYVVSTATGELCGEIRPPDTDPALAERGGNVAVSAQAGLESVFTATDDRVTMFARRP